MDRVMTSIFLGQYQDGGSNDRRSAVTLGTMIKVKCSVDTDLSN